MALAGSTPNTPPNRLVPVLGLLAFSTIAWSAWVTQRTQAALTSATAALTNAEHKLDEVLGEVTRIRLEQRSEQKGPQGLITKLQTYAPMLVTARTTAPDYTSAQAEMQAILRAFAALGQDAWPAVRARISQLTPEKNYDELKWLLEAAIATDQAQGTALVQSVLQGTLLPNPRLRWHAANVLLQRDKPLAQQLLRQILATESSRGPNLERSAAYNLPIPDAAAVSQNGFFNFVVHYIRSEDPQMEDTLLAMLTRNEHDLLTLQECIEALGRAKSARAADPIQRLYKNPPGRVDNPLFLTKCLDALEQILGREAVAFLETAQRDATHEKVAQHASGLLAKYR